MGFKRRELPAIGIVFSQRHHGESHANADSVSNAQRFPQPDAFTHANFGLAHTSINSHCEE